MKRSPPTGIERQSAGVLRFTGTPCGPTRAITPCEPWMVGREDPGSAYSTTHRPIDKTLAVDAEISPFRVSVTRKKRTVEKKPKTPRKISPRRTSKASSKRHSRYAQFSRIHPLTRTYPSPVTFPGGVRKAGSEASGTDGAGRVSVGAGVWKLDRGPKRTRSLSPPRFPYRSLALGTNFKFRYMDLPIDRPPLYTPYVYSAGETSSGPMELDFVDLERLLLSENADSLNSLDLADTRPFSSKCFIQKLHLLQWGFSARLPYARVSQHHFPEPVSGPRHKSADMDQAGDTDDSVVDVSEVSQSSGVVSALVSRPETSSSSSTSSEAEKAKIRTVSEIAALWRLSSVASIQIDPEERSEAELRSLEFLCSVDCAGAVREEDFEPLPYVIRHDLTFVFYNLDSTMQTIHVASKGDLIRMVQDMSGLFFVDALRNVNALFALAHVPESLILTETNWISAFERYSNLKSDRTAALAQIERYINFATNFRKEVNALVKERHESELSEV
eukprot:263835_1